MTDDKICEAFYSIEEQGMDKGKKITIHTKGKTPKETWDLFMKIKEEMINED